VVKVICHKAHRCCRRMVQRYSTGDGNVSFHKGTSAIELVHPSAQSSPQSKRQMDRFSRFCTAYGRKCLYFTMGAPIHQNCPFPWGIWTSHVTRDAFGPCEPTTQTAPRRFSRLCTDDRGVSLLFTMVCLFPPENCPFPCNTWFIGPTRVRNANGNLIVSAVFCRAH